VRYFLDEIGSDVSTLLGPAVVLVAIIGTLRIALHQPDQTATPTPESSRTPAPARRTGPASSPAPSSAPSSATMTPAMPAGFQWDEAGPVPRFRSGFALVVILAVVGALLAVVVAGVVLAAAAAVRSSLG